MAESNSWSRYGKEKYRCEEYGTLGESESAIARIELLPRGLPALRTIKGHRSPRVARPKFTFCNLGLGKFVQISCSGPACGDGFGILMMQGVVWELVRKVPLSSAVGPSAANCHTRRI